MFAIIARLVARIGHSRATGLLVACGLLIGMVVAGGVVLLLIGLRYDAIANSERELKNLALTISEEMDRGLQGVDLLQLGLIEHMRQLGIASPETFEQQMNSF